MYTFIDKEHSIKAQIQHRIDEIEMYCRCHYMEPNKHPEYVRLLNELSQLK